MTSRIFTVHLDLVDRSADLTLTEIIRGGILSAWNVHDEDGAFLGTLVENDGTFEAHIGERVYRPYETRDKALAVLVTASAV